MAYLTPEQRKAKADQRNVLHVDGEMADRRDIAKAIVKLIKGSPAAVFSDKENPEVEMLKPAGRFASDVIHRQIGINGRIFQKAVVDEHKPALFLAEPLRDPKAKIENRGNFLVVDDARIWMPRPAELIIAPKYKPETKELLDPGVYQVIGAHALDLVEMRSEQLIRLEAAIEQRVT